MHISNRDTLIGNSLYINVASYHMTHVSLLHTLL